MRAFRQCETPGFDPSFWAWICSPKKPRCWQSSKMSTTFFPFTHVLMEGPTHWISISFQSPFRKAAFASARRASGVVRSSHTISWR